MALELAAAPKPRGSVRRLGRYELIQLLAKGGMGEVYLARTRGLGGFERLVVIKCALSTDVDQPQGLLLAEAKLAATLQHTNVVQVYDVGIEGSTVFLAMEYLHGQDARAIVRRSWGQHRALRIDQAIAIVIAACAGLHYAHDKHDVDGSALEIVHRDVSPSNVFVTYDGGVKVIDFGIAKATTLPSETEVGTVKGKLGYMSPEQCRCEPLDRRSDVFGLGILLYELTTGRRTFHGANEYLMNKQVIELDPPRPSAVDASYPMELEGIVMRALAKQRRDRPPTALALQDELAAFASTHGLDLSQLALGRVMAELFADELAAWEQAQRAGQSLVDHVIKRTTTSAAIVDEPRPETAPTVALHPAPPSPSRSRRPWIAAITALVAAIPITIVLVSRDDATVERPPEQAPPARRIAPHQPPSALAPVITPPHDEAAIPSAPVITQPPPPSMAPAITHQRPVGPPPPTGPAITHQPPRPTAQVITHQLPPSMAPVITHQPPALAPAVPVESAPIASPAKHKAASTRDPPAPTPPPVSTTPPPAVTPITPHDPDEPI